MLNAIGLLVPNSPIQTATLDFVIHTDDGTTVYMNDQSVTTPFGGTATMSVDVTSMTVPGQNYLYFETRNGISQMGMAVSGTLTTQHVPEPASAVCLLMLSVLIGGLRFFKRVWF